MEFLLRNGDYVPDSRGGLTTLDGAQEVLARVLFRMQARRGTLPFLPELGSQLYLLPREKPSARQALALRYVSQALEEDPDVKVQDVTVTQLADGHLKVVADLEWQGQQLTVSTAI